MKARKTERPILFSLLMVQAILEGRKTMTRRIVQTTQNGWDAQKLQFKRILILKPATGNLKPKLQSVIGVNAMFTDDSDATMPELGINCKYGKPGDKIWVKEAYYAYGYWSFDGFTKTGKPKSKFNDLTGTDFQYRFPDNPPSRIKTKKSAEIGWYLRSSLFMPRKAARIWLEITDIRVERLQDISENDAIAEGVVIPATVMQPILMINPHVFLFQLLWEDINGLESWNANPWVWVIQFKKVEPCQ